MTRTFLTAAVVCGALLVAQAVEACTASTVWHRATRNQDTEYYDNVKDVIDTDQEIQDEGWTHPEATHGAIGTVMREAWERHAPGEYELEVYERLLDDTARIRALLNETADIQHMGHPTVRDHAILHGGEWEDIITGGGTPPGGGPPPPPPPPIDHAG